MSRPRFRNARHALCFLLEHGPRMSAAPSLDGAHLVRTSTLNGAGDVVGEYYVATPRVDGGPGSVRDDRLCDLADIELCLPTDRTEKLCLLTRTMYDDRQAMDWLREYEGSRWHWRKLYAVYDRALGRFTDALRLRGLVR